MTPAENADATRLPVVPVPHRWVPGDGEFRLHRFSRLVLGDSLADAVAPLLPGLRTLTGLPLPSSTLALAGDMGVRLDRRLPPQGYRLSVTDRAVLTAADPAGAFYGLQTLLKLLGSAADGRTLPQGEIRDAPRAAVRGVMLDVGRRRWDLDGLRAFVRRAAWLGCNRIQLHLTEWNGFRVRLPGFEELAAEDAYTPAEINELIALAARHHIEVVPEIDLPAHATALIAHRPGLRFTGTGGRALNDGSEWTGEPTDGWVMDITKKDNRDWIAGLLTAFVTALDSRTVHLGGDEWPPEPRLSRCAALTAYARSLDPSYRATDALVAFLNDMAGLVRALGRTVELWNWWEHAARHDVRVAPDQDIRLTVWEPHDAEPGRGTDYFTDRGYDVITSPLSTHYVTPRTAPGNRPGNNHVAPDPRRAYADWETEPGGAHQVCVWADWAEEQPDAYFVWHARRPLEVLADRMWGGPRHAHVDRLLDVLDQLDQDELTRGRGGPAAPRAEATGPEPIAPAGGPTVVRRVRFRPPVGPDGEGEGQWTAATAALLDATLGVRFQGADDPDGPWYDLAEVVHQPTATWNELRVEDPAPEPYRWLRAYGAPGGLDTRWYGERGERRARGGKA
ncbi:family 20 glycosylhydrolase [Streptomyces sp. NPDC051658]|uniref:family 20 glycosylhydrolase n=1 Tax=Streptomyces sp. NPDC051658 TaxID=3365667 RepID=UPI0037928A0D